MSYLITCSGKKIISLINNPSEIKNLSYSDELLNARLKLIELTGIELDWNRTLPAWQLYIGPIVYRKINLNNWTKPHVDIKILSALFGWINHNDLIPIYNLAMDNTVNGVKPSTFWRNTNLLNPLINVNDLDLLSNNYRKAIANLNVNATIPDINIEIYGNDNRGHFRGKWLNDQLNQL